MVAPAPTTPLPTLSKPDRLRLTLYFATGQSTEALALELLQIQRQQSEHLAGKAESSSLSQALIIEGTALAPILSDSSSDSASLRRSVTSSLPDSYDLASWTLSPEIAPHIAYHRAESLERRKQSALQELDTLLATSDSPIERRRAATTMLRMLTRSNSPALRSGGDRPGGREPDPQRPHSSPPSPAHGRGGGSARAAGGEGSVSTASPPADELDSAPHSVTASSSHPHPSVPFVVSSPHLRSFASSAAASDLGSSGPSVASSPSVVPPYDTS